MHATSEQAKRLGPPIPAGSIGDPATGSTQEGEAAPQEWPLILWGLACWLLPATAARRTRMASKTAIYVWHLAGVFAGFFLIVAVVAWIDNSRAFGAVLGEFFDSLASPRGATWVLIGLFLLIESIFVLVAVLLTPWGALDEPVKESFFNSLRQTWLHTAHVLVAIVLFGVANAAVTMLEVRLVVSLALQQELAIPLTIISGAFLAAWLIWALARSISAARETLAVERPPMCAECGYNLTSMAMDARCPECGMPVLRSIGEESQPGASWESRDKHNIIAAWARTVRLAVSCPEKMGRLLRVRTGSSHRGFAALHFPVIFLVAGTILLSTFVLLGESDDLLRELFITAAALTVFSSVCTLASFAVMNLGALLIGALESWNTKRNMLPISMQMAAYLATYLVAWEVVGGVWTACIMVQSEGRFGVFLVLEEWTGIYRDTLALAAFLIPNLIAFGVYLWLIGRGTRAARFANR